MHPTLAALLAEWKLEGWEATYGWKPDPDDLVAPLPVGRKVPEPRMRQKNQSYTRWVKDLEALDLRHRRLHDFRRTMISLSRMDGARGSLLKVCTHGPNKAAMIDAYTTYTWEALCAEVAKLRMQRTTRAELLLLPMAASQLESRGFSAPPETTKIPTYGTPHGTLWKRTCISSTFPTKKTGRCALPGARMSMSVCLLLLRNFRVMGHAAHMDLHRFVVVFRGKGVASVARHPTTMTDALERRSINQNSYC